MKWIAIALCIFVFYLFSQVPSYQSYQDKAAAKKAAVESEPLTDKGKKIRVKHIEWSNDICNMIANKQVVAGMTTEQAKMAWGRPYKINFTTYGNGREHEQWVMSENRGDYLYFENGILTNIQGTK